MKSTVSVIIPAYNSEKTIGCCLEALKKQTVRPLETIVVDGNSSDRTAEVARELDARIFVEEKKGPAAARNLGVKKARGDILLFIDADCIPVRTWIETMSEWVMKTGVVGGSVESSAGDMHSKADDISMFSYYSLSMPSRSSTQFITANLGIKKSIFFQAGGFDETLPVGEDMDFCMRVKQIGHICHFVSDAAVKHNHKRCGLHSLVKRHYKAGITGGQNRMKYSDQHSSFRFFPRNPYVMLLFSPALALASSIICTARASKQERSNMFLLPLVAIGKFSWLLGAFKGIREMDSQ